jgi:hypothetical protein
MHDTQARKGSRSHAFYTLPEYEAWREGLGPAGTAGWDIKYYKGACGTRLPRRCACLGGSDGLEAHACRVPGAGARLCVAGLHAPHAPCRHHSARGTHDLVHTRTRTHARPPARNTRRSGHVQRQGGQGVLCRDGAPPQGLHLGGCAAVALCVAAARLTRQQHTRHTQSFAAAAAGTRLSPPDATPATPTPTPIRTPPPPGAHTPANAPHASADEEDGAALEMAFSKKRVEDRKRWLSAFAPGTFLDQSVGEIPYKDFVHKVWVAQDCWWWSSGCVCVVRWVVRAGGSSRVAVRMRAEAASALRACRPQPHVGTARPPPPPTHTHAHRSSSCSAAPTWSAPSRLSWTGSSPGSARSCSARSSAT